MLEHLKPDDRFSVILSYVYRIIGRVALIASFLLAVDGDLSVSVACIAVAFWMMWSDPHVSVYMIGQTVDLLAAEMKKKDSVA